VRQIEPFAATRREFLVEVDGPQFGAIGRLSLSAPVRLSDFVNECESFLRLTEVEFLADPDPNGPEQASSSSASAGPRPISIMESPSGRGLANWP
jgi:hypothetical protein